jgi:hypothetical protein
MIRRLALVALLALVSSMSVAAPRSRVLVVCTNCQVDSLLRLKSELRFVALDPEDAPPHSQDGQLSPAWIENALRGQSAQALVDVMDQTARIHVPTTSGGLQVDTLSIRPDERWETEVTELLRARLLPIPEPPPAPKARQQEVAMHAEKPARSGGALGLWFGPGMIFSPGGLGSLGQIWLVPSLRVRSWLELEMLLAAPISAARVSSTEGTADVRVGLATLGARILLARDSWTVRPSVGIGAGMGVAKIEGSANAPLLSQSGWVIPAVVTADAGLAIVLPWRLWLQFDLRAGVAMPRPAVDFAGRQVATWGRPFAAAVVGVGIRL